VDGIKLPTAAYHFEEGPEITSPPPGFSEHTDEILSDLGYSSDDINTFKAEGVIK
jgi:crotonobetainyl-CoA:carnitine CoA-transferase CaiB-like acyl-CoA transferase